MTVMAWFKKERKPKIAPRERHEIPVKFGLLDFTKGVKDRLLVNHWERYAGLRNLRAYPLQGWDCGSRRRRWILRREPPQL